MAKTTAQVFTFDELPVHDGGWGTDIREVVENGGEAGGDTSIAAHPNAAGTTSITVDPYTTRSTQNDDRTNFGWAWNHDAASPASMASTSTAKRRIPSGAWRFQHTVGFPAPGLLGSHNLTCSYRVYRVGASPGFARTTLFTVVSAEQAGGVGAGDVAFDTTSGSQAEILLEAGESLHIGILSTNRQVAGTLGGTAAGNMIYRASSATPFTVTVPTPGIRTKYLSTITGVMKGVATRGALKVKKTLAAVMVGIDTLVRRLTLHRPIYNTDGTPDASGNRRHGVLIGTTKPSMVLNGFSNFLNDFEFTGADADDNSSGIRSVDPIPWSNAFTLECAIRKDRTISSEVPIAWADYSNGNLYEGLQLVLTATNASAQLWKNEILQAGVSKGSIISNAAHWVAFVSDGATLSFYLDGVRLGTGAITANPTEAHYLWVGRTARDPTSPTALDPFPFDGLVEEVRLSSVARYAGASYTVPAVAFTPDADTLLLWHLDDYMPLRALGVPTLARRITAFRLLSATMLGIASLARRVVAFRVLSATMLGVASLARRITAFRVFSATMLGVPTLTPHITAFREFVAVMQGAPTLDRLIVARREIAAVMLGVASRPIILLRRTISAVAVGIASRTNRVGKTLSATMLGVPAISRLLRKLLEARAAGVATMTKLATLRRELSARMAGIARARLEMGFEVLSRIGSGAVTIVKKIFPVFDD